MSQNISAQEFSTLIQEYASYKLSIQNCSQKTVQEYLLDLRTFFRYLIARERDIDFKSKEFTKIDVSTVGLAQLEKIRAEDLYDFMYYTNATRNNQWSARSRKLSAIRSLYKYLVNKRHYLEYNPTVDIDSPKAKKTLPKVMTLDEALKLLQAVEDDRESPYRVRDYAILTLFLNCGMRVSELAGINLSDIDSGLLSMRVTGKGNKERIVYLNDACQSALREYIAVRKSNKYAHVHDNALFLSRLDQRMSVKTVQLMVYKYLKLAGLESKHYSVHKLRHTAATLMYQSGNVDVRVLKEILGHEQLNTTQIYTHVSNQDMERAMTQNPLANQKRKK
ncbi:MAG: tyrosine recombinase XerC [Clostridia bacterium]|nr:tyrosine recombinase XerC [Clostridia bacterium]MBQ3014246.1 tyrosine recombinase XerC [Clostridia bacterium]